MSGYISPTANPRTNLVFPPKNPNDVLPYGLDFTEQMTQDIDALATIQSVSVDIIASPPGSTPTTLTISGELLTADVAACIVSGGTLGTVYRLHFVVTTNKGSVYDRSGSLSVMYIT